MCSIDELYTGGYEMARVMGWFRFTGEIWTRNTETDSLTSTDEMEDPNIFRLSICCVDA